MSKKSRLQIQIISLAVFFLNSLAYGSELTVPIGTPFKPVIFSVSGSFRNSNLYFTVAPDVTTVGPMYTEQTEGEYVQETFKNLLQQSHEVARDFHSSDNSAYYTFLVLSLAVPHHESQLTHFRLTEPTNCNQANNQLTSLRRPQVRSKMQVLYRSPKSQIFPNCKAVQKEDQIKQVILSGNKDDVGIMQLNPYFHQETVKPYYYLNMPMSAEYGFQYLKGMFNEIYFQADSKYAKCLDTSHPLQLRGTRPTKTILSKLNRKLNAVRGIWASYNQGNTLTDSVCRIKSRELADKRFLETILAMVVHHTSIYDQYLPKGSVEALAFQELIQNFVNGGEEKRENIDKLLEEVYPNKTYLTIKATTTLRSTTKLVSAPDSEMWVGVAPSKTSVVILKKEEFNGRTWIQIQLNSGVKGWFREDINL